MVVHVEAPDEAGHSGSIEHKVEAIEKTDQEIVSRLREYKADRLAFADYAGPSHPHRYSDPYPRTGPVFALGSGIYLQWSQAAD